MPYWREHLAAHLNVSPVAKLRLVWVGSSSTPWEEDMKTLPWCSLLPYHYALESDEETRNRHTMSRYSPTVSDRHCSMAVLLTLI